MYNYSELSEKTTEQLRSIAAEMGMKKTESADSDNLINYILDEQAINYASTASEKRRKAEAKEPKRKAEKNTAKPNRLTKRPPPSRLSPKNAVANPKLKRLTRLSNRTRLPNRPPARQITPKLLSKKRPNALARNAPLRLRLRMIHSRHRRLRRATTTPTNATS